ncbi:MULTISPECIES: BLUF domain-containing protein [Ramlibacter]|uniref:BLUF domain-containing protein n=1 Tax=Ramlibacter aquaticus TaxID=2780094 RepID=A0ABR9SFU9_9BURK|nr:MULTISPECIES: BLUF domain-containing protein [Ramlibacter]MBE7941229.1 BLUF domain-containing protein [Ramlibacter aquaticus]
MSHPDPNPGSALHGLIYVSSATRTFRPEELDRLLQKARRVNTTRNITGVLLHGGGNFMQVLEGPAADLAEVYGRIVQNPAHTQVVELFHGDIERREFEGWSMACREISQLTFEHLRLAPHGRHHALISDFWQANC